HPRVTDEDLYVEDLPESGATVTPISSAPSASTPGGSGRFSGYVRASASESAAVDLGEVNPEDLDDEQLHDLLRQLIGGHARQLSDQEVCLIADALQAEEAVTIVYDDAEGQRTRRVIEPLALDGHLLEAWCRLRDDERVFSLSGIRE